MQKRPAGTLPILISTVKIKAGLKLVNVVERVRLKTKILKIAHQTGIIFTE
jgi:hypothetical protein